MDIYKIKWIDAHTPDIGWHSADQLRDEIEDDFVIISVGFLFEETDNYISLVQNHDADNEKFSNMISIPRDCIKEKIKL